MAPVTLESSEVDRIEMVELFLSTALILLLRLFWQILLSLNRMSAMSYINRGLDNMLPSFLYTILDLDIAI
jgi:hypothetical protein